MFMDPIAFGSRVTVNDSLKIPAFAGMTCKGIKREATCGLAFDSHRSHTSKRNDTTHECVDPIGRLAAPSRATAY